MADYLQIVVVLGAILLEYEMFTHAKALHEGDRKEVWKGIWQSYPILFALALMLCAFGYLVLSIVWVFSPVLPIRIAGICLVCLGAISLVFQRVPRLEKLWYNPVLFRITSVISAGCLGTVAFVKGCGL